MKLIKAEKNNIPSTYKWGKAQKVILDFIDSGMEAAEVQWDEGEYKSVYSVTTTLANATKNLHRSDTVRAVASKGKCYLVRKDV